MAQENNSVLNVTPFKSFLHSFFVLNLMCSMLSSDVLNVHASENVFSVTDSTRGVEVALQQKIFLDCVCSRSPFFLFLGCGMDQH